MSKNAGWQLNEWLNYLEVLHPVEIDLGLERVKKVYKRLGCPRPATRIISVAGTNGKGSVTAHITAMATAAGLKCGSYTSPHLLAFNERFNICGQWAGDKDICRAFVRIEQARAEISLSYFEFSTLAGILLMARKPLDLAVFEVGLGGRLDAVNILAADCAVITSIALDHQDWLGNDRELIAVEKAGIFRQWDTAGNFNQSIIIGDRQPPLSLSQAVTDSQQTAACLGVDFDWRQLADTDEISIYCNTGGEEIQLPESPLAAPIQNDNLAVAFCALRAIGADLSIDITRLQTEFAQMELRGRLEQISHKPDIFADVAHNPAAAKVLASWLQSVKSDRKKIAGKIWCVCAMLSDKDAAEVCRIIDPWVDNWLLAGLGGSRGQSAEALQDKIMAGIRPPQRCFPDVPHALHAASELAATDDLILVFGSFLTVEQAIRHWNE